MSRPSQNVWNPLSQMTITASTCSHKFVSLWSIKFLPCAGPAGPDWPNLFIAAGQLPAIQPYTAGNQLSGEYRCEGHPTRFWYSNFLLLQLTLGHSLCPHPSEKSSWPGIELTTFRSGTHRHHYVSSTLSTRPPRQVKKLAQWPSFYDTLHTVASE